VFACQELDLEITEDSSTTLAFGDSMESNIVLDCASPAVSSMDRKLPRIVSSAVADGYVKDTLSTQTSTASDYVFACQELDLEITEDSSTTLSFGDSMESNIVLDCASPAVSSMDRKFHPRLRMVMSKTPCQVKRPPLQIMCLHVKSLILKQRRIAVPL
jgi:hypothetical protein